MMRVKKAAMGWTMRIEERVERVDGSRLKLPSELGRAPGEVLVSVD